MHHRVTDANVQQRQECLEIIISHFLLLLPVPLRSQAKPVLSTTPAAEMIVNKTQINVSQNGKLHFNAFGE